MKSGMHYRIQIVGNTGTVKRMVASLYLVGAKNSDQVLKVCICDDLPHVINAVEGQQKTAPSHDQMETGLLMQVAYGRSLTVSANVVNEDDNVCVIAPQQEVTIPAQAVWESNVAFATDFHVHMRRPYEDASVQIAISSKDEHGSDIPLIVPSRVHVSWHPKDVAGVQRIRKTWEASEEKAQTIPRQYDPSAARKTTSLPRYQQPKYQSLEKLLQGRVSPRAPEPQLNGIHPAPTATTSSRYGGKPLPVQDKNWNVVTSPRDVTETSEDQNLPQWAKGLGDQFDYDDVVVV
nr:uncharacterized protein LOC100175484 [Ciona intestinalis]|eukprot:XP_002125456.1 uncharacterized protein LOC100175484 [Ciona intestinalis]